MKNTKFMKSIKERTVKSTYIIAIIALLCALAIPAQAQEDYKAVRSHVEKPQVNADGSYDLYFGPKAPAGKESMWIKTIPGKGWWSAFRIYGPEASAFDGTWKLDDIVEMK